MREAKTSEKLRRSEQHGKLRRLVQRSLKGTVVEGRGDAKRVLKPGDFWLETFDTSHWFVNPSTTEAAELWVVDIVPKKK